MGEREGRREGNKKEKKQFRMTFRMGGGSYIVHCVRKGKAE